MTAGKVSAGRQGALDDLGWKVDHPGNAPSLNFLPLLPAPKELDFKSRRWRPVCRRVLVYLPISCGRSVNVGKYASPMECLRVSGIFVEAWFESYKFQKAFGSI